jgi:hypothetical protein
VVHGTSAVQALRMLDLLDPGARLYFSRKFKLGGGGGGGHELKPSWALGLYVRLLAEEGEGARRDVV